MQENVNQTDFSNIKSLSVKQLPSVAQRLREQIISSVSENGGHLSANLGVVELSLALHYVFDLPKDKLIFDVGHQCYSHKLLSGRASNFSDLRKKGGVSGFPDRKESQYDSFGTGHAGTSISASLGFCQARDTLGEDYHVVTVVGDGALVNGLNLEALTVSGSKPKKLIVILNDNGMSISKNKNGFYNFLSKRTAGRPYINSKKVAKKLFGRGISGCLGRVKAFIKRVFNKNGIIDTLGFKYVGIVDGNNVNELVKILQKVKLVSQDKAVFLHVKTTKGKGFERFEEHSDIYHGVGKNLEYTPTDVSRLVGEKLNKIINDNPSVMAVTAGMKDGTGLCLVEKEHPQNFIDVGIAEEYAVTLSAGMAAGGLKPVIVMYSTFLQRAYDQIVHDVCLQNLPVVFCIDHAGFVGEDGKTHQGLFDLSYLYHIPNLKIIAPTSCEEIAQALDYALTLNCPVAIRYSKSCRMENKTEKQPSSLQESPWITEKQGTKATILAVGPNMKNLALSVSEKVDGVGVISARVLKPIDEIFLGKIDTPLIITLEENAVLGGFGQVVATYYAQNKKQTKVIVCGAKDSFVEHGNVGEQMADNGLTEESIIKLIQEN